MHPRLEQENTSRVFYIAYVGWRIFHFRVRKYKVEAFDPRQWMKEAVRKYRIRRSRILILIDRS